MATKPAFSAGISFIRDEEMEQLLKKMSKPIFDAAGLSFNSVRFYIVENKELNAFVLGGQNIFLHTGLIVATDNAAELLGVIAHETGHISSGHIFRTRNESTNASFKTILANLIGIAVAVGTGSADAGFAIGNLGTSIVRNGMFRHSRTQEGSADASAVKFLKAAGIPLTGMLSFMKKLESQELLPQSQQDQYLITHPLTQDRISFLQDAVNNNKNQKISKAWPRQEKEYKRVKAKLIGYLFPTQALNFKGNSISNKYAKSIAYFKEGETDKSLKLIKNLLKIEPNNPYFYELEGQVFYESGRIEESISAYSKSVKFAPYSALIREAYAKALLQSNDNKVKKEIEAIKQLKFALRRDSQMSESHHFLAIAYGRQGRIGLSSLHLSEEALMRGNLKFAKKTAGMAKDKLKNGSPAYIRAEDIMRIIDRQMKKIAKKK